MIRKAIATLIAVITVMSFTACSPSGGKRYEAQFLELFDTITTIVGYSNSEEQFAESAKLIQDELRIYHQLYDIYNDYPGIANIKTINDNAGIAPVKVDARIIDLLVFAKEVNLTADGKINVAFGAVLKIWHAYRERGIDDPQNSELPPIELLLDANLHTNINDIIIDEAAGTVYLKDPQMSIDVGAIAKGYAVEQVSLYAIKNGFTSGLISVGGNVRVIGEKADTGEPWKVGIKNPYSPEDQEDFFVTSLKDLSLVTSGDYIRYYTVDGIRYHHIIDPQTLFPSAYFKAVSIICQDSGMADALSTSVYNMPFEQGLDFIKSLPNTEAVWFFLDGETKFSSHFQDMLYK